MSTTPEAIAAKLEAASRDRWAFGLDLAGAAAELRRLAAVEAERDQLREVIADKNAALDLMRQAADQLRAEVEALRADADRWRLLERIMAHFPGNLSGAVEAARKA